MPDQGYHYEGEQDTVIRVDCGQDVSAATVKEIHIRKPNGTEETHTATLFGTNYLQYTEDELDEVGTWIVHPYVEMPTPFKGLGKADTFEVLGKFDTPD